MSKHDPRNGRRGPLSSVPPPLASAPSAAKEAPLGPSYVADFTRVLTTQVGTILAISSAVMDAATGEVAIRPAVMVRFDHPQAISLAKTILKQATDLKLAGSRAAQAAPDAPEADAPPAAEAARVESAPAAEASAGAAADVAEPPAADDEQPPGA